MAGKRKIEVYSAGCAICQLVVDAIKAEACSSWEVIVHDMQDSQVARRAMDLGIQSVPAVVMDGKLAPCCEGRGVDIDQLILAGLGRPRK